MSILEKALKKVANDNGTLSDYELISKEYDLELQSIDTIKEYLLSCGLRTLKTSYLDEIYCVVDIETTGSKPDKSQIIEIGAIKYFRGKIVDKFESLIYAEHVPENITDVTNIKTEDLKDAPHIKDALSSFKLFLGDSVFVAHNANFDFRFICASFKKYNLGIMLNPRVCTIDLSRRCIDLQKYGLKSMIEYFGLDSSSHHRAYFDAMVALKVLDECFKKIPWYVESLDDLIVFSKSKLKKKNTKVISS